jgi:hypothetical protein
MKALLLKRRCGIVGLSLAFLGAGAMSAKADRPIGVALEVKPTVEQIGAPGGDNLKIGDAIFMNEAIKTGPTAAATIKFTDDAQLTIDSESRTVLSSFIFSDPKRYLNATIHLARGSFHFAGGSNSRAYVFKTPTAVLTPRDASFDVDVTERVTSLRVASGSVELCRRSAGNASLQKSEDDARDKNAIAFAKAPSLPRGECSLIDAADGGANAGDPVVTPADPPPIPLPPPYDPTPPPVSPH